MPSTRKIVLGFGIASGALLAAWLMTGDRGQKTKSYIVRRARSMKDTLKAEEMRAFDDSEVHYV